MLQQTRVTTALPYFERWTDRFPDFSSLAEAGEEEVPTWKDWVTIPGPEICKLAKEIVGWPTIPEDPESWQALPGIGPYMAAAVAGISFGFPEAVCDGNGRSLSRIFATFRKPFGTEPPPKEKFVRWPRPCSTGRTREISTRR